MPNKHSNNSTQNTTTVALLIALQYERLSWSGAIISPHNFLFSRWKRQRLIWKPRWDPEGWMGPFGACLPRVGRRRTLSLRSGQNEPTPRSYSNSEPEPHPESPNFSKMVSDLESMSKTNKFNFWIYTYIIYTYIFLDQKGVWGYGSW